MLRAENPLPYCLDSYDTGVYPISMAPFCFGDAMPKRIAAAGIKDEATGVDLSGGVTLEYEGKGMWAVLGLFS